SGLPLDSTSDSARKVFSQYGTVKEANILPIKEGKQAAAAFIIMNTVEDAKWIVENVNGNVPQGLTEKVSAIFATPKDQRKGGGKGKMKGMEAMMGMMAMMMGMGGGWGGGWKGGWGKGGGSYNPAKHKTVLCRMFEADGVCPRGESCTFAHGAHELKGVGKGATNGVPGQMALGMGMGKGW
ncbi:ZFP36L1, partial [Symbiodinium pilosum]